MRIDKSGVARRLTGSKKERERILAEYGVNNPSEIFDWLFSLPPGRFAPMSECDNFDPDLGCRGHESGEDVTIEESSDGDDDG